jgi:DNA sulfur modification protein DndD
VQLRKIILKNWGPYRGTSEVPLAVEPTAPIVLIHGENMRGKTSLLRAMKWCLYGELMLQDGRTPLDHLRLVNNDEIEHGETEYLVELEFEHNDEILTLTRSGLASIDEFGERRSSVVKTTLRTATGVVYPEQNISEVVEQMLDKNIADFFLFDGEMLIRFDERLREDAQSKKAFIKQQVEKALGLPFLKRLIADLAEVHQRVSEELTKGNRADDRARKLQGDIAAVDAQLEIHQVDVAALAARQELLRVSIEQLDGILKDVAEIRDAYVRREGLVEQQAASDRKIKNLLAEAAEFAEANWWFPIASMIAEELDASIAKVAELGEEASASAELQFELRQVRGQQDSKTCSHCGQSLPEDARESLAHREKELLKQIALLPKSEDPGVLHGRIQSLAKFRGASAVESQYQQMSQAIGRERLEHHRLTTQVTELSEALSSNSLDIRAKETELGQARAELASASSKAAEVESQISLMKQRRQGLVSDLGKLQGTSPLLARRVEIYGEAVRTAEESLNTFRQRMRERVQDEASTIFRALTTEDDFAGIRLNEDYSLAVLHSDGSPVDLISAGGNQVLTMAFIGALGASSSNEAPLVMDTPLGRLDVGHREHILRWLATLTSQVILFVQSGEFDPDRDRALLGTAIGRELVIRRGDSAEQSLIEEKKR